MTQSDINSPRTTRRGAVIAILCLWLALVGQGVVAGTGDGVRQNVSINPGWRFWLGEAPSEAVQANFDDQMWDVVSLPHTMEIFPADLKGFKEHGRNLGWYRRTLKAPEAWAGRRVFLVFHGAMQTTRLWVNGGFVGEYAVSGYDSFSFDITTQLKAGRNQIAVRVDNTPNPDTPPDCYTTDFMQFGGLYRDVEVVVADPVHITFPWEAAQAGVRLTLPEVSTNLAVVQAETAVRNDGPSAVKCLLTTEVRDARGRVASSVSSEQTLTAGGVAVFQQTCPPIANPQLWSPDDPYLYRVHSVVRVAGRVVDEVQTRYGIRWCEFTRDRGFFLNGRPLKLVGANRHQTWPWIGGAVPRALHRLDAEQIKSARFNWVRLSHYPHDPYFLDQLDELGLLALEEGPTWWGVGGDKWMANLEESFRRMIRRDRNHPSLMIWNCCINHGGANPRLVNAATEEDPTRPRGQDNVPCPMNFDRGTVSGDGALTIEHTGHTFPCVRGDGKEYELAKRHWEMVDAAYRKADNSGLAVWCMYDYNTLYNCNQGIANHGVFDLFRLPKQSFWWHQSELGAKPVAHIVPAGPGKVCVFANTGEVLLSQDLGDGFKVVAVQKPDAGFALKHPPFHFSVDTNAVAFKAEAIAGGKVVAADEWRAAGKPVALSLRADRETMFADGSDLIRVVVSAVDERGTLVTIANPLVAITVTGAGQSIGENPVTLRNGQMIALIQAGFEPGKIQVQAASQDLRPAKIRLKTTRVAAGVDVPRDWSFRLPTRSQRVVIPQTVVQNQSSWLTLPPVRNAEPNAWAESQPILVPKEMDGAAITIRGGEYRIYTSPWGNQPGTVRGGDAVYVRVKSRQPGPDWADDGRADWAELTIGNEPTRFEVFPQKKQTNLP